MNWIHVTEKLPEPDERVLAWNAQWQEQVVAYVYNGFGQYHWTDGEMTIHTITYWMPLPNPPCPRCNQTFDLATTGEYACSLCDMPRLHDE